jgi:Calcineurin-like phosphoesterase
MRNGEKQSITTVYSADWHLADGPRFDYRWRIFDQLEKLIQDTGARYLIFCGDLCENKDNHGARLVNRVCRELRRLAKALTANSESHASIFLIKGNHDCIGAGSVPFFRFLHRGLMGRIFYFDKPTEMGLWQQRFLFLPHTDNFQEYVGRYDFKAYDRIIIHQPVRRAVGENGFALEEGIDAEKLFGTTLDKFDRAVIAGDIHVPQSVGNLTYAGAPHPIKYGDDFQPRVLVETDGVFRSVKLKSVKKAVVRISDIAGFRAAGLAANDMAKVEILLPRADFHHYNEIAKGIERVALKNNIHLGSLKLVEKITRKRLVDSCDVVERKTDVSPMAVLKGYAKTRKIDEQLLLFGNEVLK